jgi:type IV pilus assembly protein PilF
MSFWSQAPSLGAGGLSWSLRLHSFKLLLLSAWLLMALPSIAQQERRFQARLALSSAYLQADMLALAMTEVDKILLASPQLPEALALKAVILHKQARFELADRYFQQATLLAPENPQIAHNWAMSECAQGRFESAFDKFEFAHAHSEGLDKDKSLWLWGDCLRQNLRWDEANVKMSQALLRQPSFFSEALVLAELKIQLGRGAEAEKILDVLNDSPSVSAQSLWLSLQLAQGQNQAVKKNQWGRMLGRLFSNSAQWRAYQEGASHD